nr:MAG TPA: hypothetical protein [Caudoviricetes sp.]
MSVEGDFIVLSQTSPVTRQGIFFALFPLKIASHLQWKVKDRERSIKEPWKYFLKSVRFSSLRGYQMRMENRKPSSKPLLRLH